jgi:hypothetical protein
MSDKDRGLEASKEDKVGFFERLRMGNIDDEGSEAYRRFGAGRGKAERTPVETMAATPVTRPTASAQAMPAAAAMDELEAANARERIPVPAGPKVEKPRVNTQAAKPSAPTKSAPAKSAPAKTSAYPMTRAQPTTKTYSRTGGASAEDRASYKPSASQSDAIPGQSVKSPIGEKVEPMSDSERNLQNILMGAGGVGGAAGAFYKGKKMLDARKAAQAGAKKRANLKRDVEEGIDRNLADEFQNLASSAAKNTASGAKKQDYRSLTGSAREDAKANQAYDKLKQLSSRNADKTSSRKTKKFNDDEANVEFKRGGKAYASGGSVSSASKRGDGIATRGKTNCKMR